jgi:hypothetical protein
MTLSKRSLRVLILSVLLALTIFTVGQIWNATDTSSESTAHIPDTDSGVAINDKWAPNTTSSTSEVDNERSRAQKHGDHKTTSSSSAATLPIAPRGKGQEIAWIYPELWERTEKAMQDMNDPLPEIRATAIVTLINEQGERALDIVLPALEDSDPQVRVRALSQGMNHELDIPLDTIRQMAEEDPSPEVRLMSLIALASYPKDPQSLALQLRATAELALNDSDESVQQQAHQILEQLDRPASIPLDDVQRLRHQEWKITQGSSEARIDCKGKRQKARTQIRPIVRCGLQPSRASGGGKSRPPH